MDEQEIITTFQQHKRGKKYCEESLCMHHETHRGQKGVDISSIKMTSMWMVANILTCHVMRKRKKEQCNLDILLVIEACLESHSMNWC
jgi:uncharacterized protein YbaP (TraB family)